MGEVMTQELGRLEDLPADYVQNLRDLNLVPLWPSLRGVLPANIPTRQTRPIHWPYQSIKPLLLKAGELTPIEKAERRVLVLANPGHGLDKMQASSAIYLGMQLLLPGEWAPSHRHTPNAVRMIVEGEGAYTTVDGEKCPMQRGDLILTPTGLWHEHGHDGTEPVIWLDVLDLPLVYYMEASYHVNGKPQTVVTGRGDKQYAMGESFQQRCLSAAKKPTRCCVMHGQMQKLHYKRWLRMIPLSNRFKSRTPTRKPEVMQKISWVFMR
jgi:gentisate 1,2-dioxygenase